MAAKSQQTPPRTEDELPFLPQSHPRPPTIPVYGVPATQPPYVLVPLYRTRLRFRRPRHCDCSCRYFSILLTFLSLLLLSGALFFLWPSDPELKVVRLQFGHVKVVTNPIPYLDISLDLEVRVRNPDFFSLNYESIVSSIWYRGRKLGLVTSDGGTVKARGISYIQAKLTLNGVRFLTDTLYLIEDLARGFIPFDTTTEIDGTVHILFLHIPIKGKISCSVHVNVRNQTVIHQDCYPAMSCVPL